jgi:hypothetical protein
VELVSLLAAITAAGRGTWVRRFADPGLVFFFAAGELIEFTTYGSEGEPGPPSGAVHGVLGKLRNIGFLWLEGLGGWDALLALLRTAPVDDEAFGRLYAQSQASVVEDFRTHVEAHA